MNVKHYAGFFLIRTFVLIRTKENWIVQDSSKLRKIPCFRSCCYEPYVILRNSPDTPKYDDHFMGYGKNKIEQMHHLRWAGFIFYVLPQSYLIHAPHLKSEAKKVWSNSSAAKHMDMRWVDEDDFLIPNDFTSFLFI